jgi:hypothetical protein
MSIFSKPGSSDDSKAPLIVKKAPIIIKKVPKAESDTATEEKSPKAAVGNDSFFSGLGFKKKVVVAPKPIEDKKVIEQKIEEQKKEEARQSNEDFLSQATQIAKKNAVVVRSGTTPSRPANTSSNRPAGR